MKNKDRELDFFTWKRENISVLVDNFVKENKESFMAFCSDEFEAFERMGGYK